MKNKSMKKNFRKLITLLFVAACFFLLCGFNPLTTPAEFKDRNLRLIDLGEMVHDSEPGKGGNREASEAGETDVKDGTREGDGKGILEQEETKQEEPEKELVISIKEEDIFVNGTKVKDAPALNVLLLRNYKGNKTATLVDDYASWKTYTDVYALLRKLGIRPKEEKKS